MNKTIDNETLLLKVESFEHRIEVLENTLSAAKEVLTLEEAALFMGISKSSLYKMTHRHELPFFRPNGKLIYFEKAELLKWMRQNRSMSEAETKEAAALINEYYESGFQSTAVQRQTGSGSQPCRYLCQGWHRLSQYEGCLQ